MIGTYREVGDQNVQDISLEEQQGTSIKVDLDASSQWIENNIRLDLSDAQVFGSQSAFSVYIAVSSNAPLTRVSVITGTLEDCGQMRLKERTIISEDHPALASMDNEWYVLVSDNDVLCQSN